MITNAPDKTFEPHQGSLEIEPHRCPHCGEALPAEPELMAPDTKVHDPNSPQVRYVAKRRRVEIFGGDSGFSVADPFAIDAERVASTEDVASWMARIAAKPWNRGEDFLSQLGTALCVARAAADRAAADRRVS